MASRRNRPRRVDREVQQAIEEMAVDGWSPTQILRALERRELEVPAIRTVQRIVRDVVGQDPSGPWALDLDEATDEDRHTLDVLADLVDWTDGRRQGLTLAEVAAIGAVHHLAPDLHPRLVYRAARIYMARRTAGESTADMDLWLAFAPWRPGGRLRYEKAIANGIPRATLDQPDAELMDSLEAAIEYRFAEALHTEFGLASPVGQPPRAIDPAVIDDAFARGIHELIETVRPIIEERRRSKE